MAALATAAITIPASASAPVVPRPLTTGSFSSSVSGGPVLGVENTGSGNPFNDYAVEGKASGDVGGVGVLGYGQQSKSYGAYGVSFGTNGIGVYGAGDGPTPAPNTTPDSTMQSTGVVGDSHSGDGVFGSTEFPNVSGISAAGSVAGVMGVDETTNETENNGVEGITTNGGYGVAAYSSDGALGSVLGLSTTATGVTGKSTSGLGGVFTSASNFALKAVTNSTTQFEAAIYGDAQLATDYGVWGQNSTGPGVLGQSASGNGLYALSASADGALITSNTGVGADIRGNPGVVARGASAGNVPLLATTNSGGNLFEVDGSGNVKYAGTISSFAKTRGGFVAVAYGARSSSPTIEDSGSAQLIGGRAAVRLDPALVEQMDLASKYRVFLTPDGDTKGLFVESKSAQGFVVRETQGGRGSLAFDYRIIADVDGQAHQRMRLARSEEEAGIARVPFAPAPAVGFAPKMLAFGQRAHTVASLNPRNAAFAPRPNFAVEHRSP